MRKLQEYKIIENEIKETVNHPIVFQSIFLTLVLVIILVAIAVICIAISVQFGGKIKSLFETADVEIDTVVIDDGCVWVQHKTI